MQDPDDVDHLDLEGEIMIDQSCPVNVEGAFGELFCGAHPKAGKLALKRLRVSNIEHHGRQVRHFRSEADIWRMLKHAHILPFLGTHLAKGYMYLVSPFIENGALPSYLEKHPDLDRLRILREIADGLAYLHEMGVVHGDVKGGNVLVSSNLHALLCDFGLAKTVDATTSTSLKGAGTVRWQAPELFNDAPRSFKTDVYAFGMTIYEVLSGKLPFSNYTNNASIIMALMFKDERPPKEPTSSRDGMPYTLAWKVAERCWAKDAVLRPSMEQALVHLSQDPHVLELANLDLTDGGSIGLLYPTTRRAGPETIKPDPYIWMEKEPKERQSWMESQNDVTEEYLSGFADRNRLKSLILENREPYLGPPPLLMGDDRWYWSEYPPPPKKRILYRSKDRSLPIFEANSTNLPDGCEVYFDSNVPESTSPPILKTHAFSRCGKYVAYILDKVMTPYRDSGTIRVRRTDAPFLSTTAAPTNDTDPGLLPDTVRCDTMYPNLHWSGDSRGFFYSDLRKTDLLGAADDGSSADDIQGPSTTIRLRYHTLGTDPSKDVTVFSKTQKGQSWMRIQASLLRPASSFLIVRLFDIGPPATDNNTIYIFDVERDGIASDINPCQIVKLDPPPIVVAHHGRKLFMISAVNAPKRKVIAFTLPASNDTSSSEDSLVFEDFLPEDPQGRRLVQMIAGLDDLYLISPSGARIKQIYLGVVGPLSITSQPGKPFFFVEASNISGFNVHRKYDLSPSEDDITAVTPQRTRHLKHLPPDEVVVQNVCYQGNDGADISMVIVKLKAAASDGTVPAILFGHRYFSSFQMEGMLAFVKAYRGIIACPEIRGAQRSTSEGPPAKRDDARARADFLAAADYLVREKYAPRDKLVITSDLADGEFVAQCVHASPKTFAVAVTSVPNYIRGFSWDDRSSPLHTIPPDQTLPPCILIAGTFFLLNIGWRSIANLDDNIDDGISSIGCLKYIATLQYAQSEMGNRNPMLLKCSVKPASNDLNYTPKTPEEWSAIEADKWSFVARILGLEWVD